ncbi:MAG: hypothetical protein FJ137_07240 [Deltaproteobacteria bacterium]|nr:hypothetical protein [Deltaproteobacteria bacterium]
MRAPLASVVALSSFLSAAWATGCAPAAAPDGPAEGEGEGEGGPQDSTEPLPADTFPCERLDAWPFSLASATRPLRVHHRTRAEAAAAALVLTQLNEAWVAQVDQLGLPAPLTDELEDGTFGCGPDERIDVFMFVGTDDAYVDVVAEETDTPEEDYAPYMVIDPSSSFGDGELRPTLFHEFHHLQQAGLDWYEPAIIYESSATFIEASLADREHDWEFTLFDVADHPEWAVDHDAGYDSYFNYGQAAYLIFLQQAYFDGGLDFFRDLWRGLPSPYLEAPDYQNVLDELLAPRGVTFVDTVPVYARWWAYAGEADDGAHFARGAVWPEPARTPLAVTGTTTATLTVQPMVLGSAYVQLSAADDGAVVVDVPAPPAGARLVVQRIPGAAGDGDVLTLPATVPGDALLIVTAMPAGAYDALARTDDVVTVTLSARAASAR